MSRALRRHHARRIFALRVDQNTTRYNSDPAWVIENAQRRVHTGCQCSCFMCRSPRTLYGNGVAALTLAEIKANDSMNDSMELI